MTSMADIERAWYSKESDRAATEFLAAFENAFKHFSMCQLPVADSDLVMANRVICNAAARLKAKGHSL